MGDLEHLADTPSSAREAVETYGPDDDYGCKNQAGGG